MDRSEWISLELTRDLLKFINTELTNLAISSSEGKFINPDNSDNTQYQMGVCVGNVGAYQMVKDYMAEGEHET